MATELPAVLPLRFKSNTQEIAMTKELREIVHCNKAAQNHAEVTKAAALNAAMHVRDIAAPIVGAAKHRVTLGLVYVAAFARGIVGK